MKSVRVNTLVMVYLKLNNSVSYTNIGRLPDQNLKHSPDDPVLNIYIYTFIAVAYIHSYCTLKYNTFSFIYLLSLGNSNANRIHFAIT